jgi:transcription antitermination factor NusG
MVTFSLLMGFVILSWAVAICAPNCEALAVRGLARQGVESYHPRFRQRQRNGEVLRPLFPGYLFVASRDMGVSVSCRSVLGTRGVVGLLMSGGEPALLSDLVVQSVRDREGRDGVVELPEAFAAGTRVRINAGVLGGLEGLCAGLNGKNRVFVLLHMLGRELTARCERADLVLA